jgi:hypothetical protein
MCICKYYLTKLVTANASDIFPRNRKKRKESVARCRCSIKYSFQRNYLLSANVPAAQSGVANQFSRRKFSISSADVDD